MGAESELSLFRYDPSVIPDEIERDISGLKGVVTIEHHGSLTLGRNLIEDTQRGMLFKRLISGDDATGTVQDNIVFVRVRRLIKKGDDTIQYVVWELCPELTSQFISLKIKEKGEKSSGELFVGLGVANLAFARGVMYDINSGKCKEKTWEKRVFNTNGFGTRSDYWRLDEEEDSYSFYVESESQIDESRFPKSIDNIDQLLVEIIDKEDSIIKDPSLPWSHWFRRIGVTARFTDVD